MFRIVIGFLMLLLASCASKQHHRYEDVELGASARLILTNPPENLWGKADTQLFTISHGEQSHSLLVSSEYAQNKLVLVGMTLQGLPVFELVFQQGKPMQITKQINTIDIAPEYLIADVQLALWPEAMLMTSLVNGRIETGSGDSKRVRNIYASNDLLVSVIYHNGEIEFTNHQRHYSFHVSSIE